MRNQCAQSAVTGTWMSGTRDSRLASSGPASCSRNRGGDIEIVKREVDQPLGGIDPHPDVRKLHREPLEPGQQDLVRERRRGADRQGSRRLAAGKAVGRLGEHGERLIDERCVDLAGAGEPKPTRFAVEQLDAEPAFERLHAVAHRAGGQVELFRGLAEAVVTGRGLENPK
jgi:hypothetical protein